MKVFLIILAALGALLLLLLALLLVRVKIILVYRGAPHISARYLFLTRTLYPKDEKPLDYKQFKKDKKKKSGKKKRKAEKEYKEGGFKEMFSFYKEVASEVIFPYAEKFGSKLRAELKTLKIEVASEDAARTALLCGAATAGGRMLLSFLKSRVDLKLGSKENIAIVSRFDRTETVCEAELVLSLRPIHALTVFVPALMKYISMKEAYKAKMNKEHNEQKKEGEYND